jgi:PTH1 family peptidyl-tRNA hydrolase
LGNPGARYHNTRHNIGFAVVDCLASFFKIGKFISEDNYAAAVAEHEDKTIMLLKPMTFMNLSGFALAAFLDDYDVPLNKMLIVLDDVNLPFGTIRLRPSGSDGGQRGMHSIIYELRTENIPRMRIGIKPVTRNAVSSSDTPFHVTADFVLSEFGEDEKESLNKILTSARDAALCFIGDGIQAAMNMYNKNFL